MCATGLFRSTCKLFVAVATFSDMLQHVQVPRDFPVELSISPQPMDFLCPKEESERPAMNEAAARDIVARTGWLLGQPAWVRDAVLGGSRLRMFAPGQFSFYAGDEAGGMYGVVDGGFGVLVPSAGNDILLCHIMRRGAWFGYGPALSGGGRKITFKAVERSRVLHLPRHELNAIGAAKPEFFRILGALNDMSYMMTAVQVVGDLLIASGERRIAAVLARIARPNPSDEPQSPWPIRLSQAEIGQMSNSSRDRVNRALAKFARAGWVTADFKTIVVNDIAALETFAATSAGGAES
jgi:CRP/FNR family transcriptional regulator, cyclic AMP receptor protein